MQDGATFHELRRIYWDKTFRALSSDRVADRYMRFEKVETWTSMISEGPAVVAEGESVLGVGMLVPCYLDRVDLVDGVPHHPRDPSRWELLVYVTPNRQRRGTGNLITGWLEDRARTSGAKSVSIDVDEHSAAFFEKRGYVRDQAEAGELGGVPMVCLDLAL